jgi:hypothetical protein
MTTFASPATGNTYIGGCECMVHEFIKPPFSWAKAEAIYS